MFGDSQRAACSISMYLLNPRKLWSMVVFLQFRNLVNFLQIAAGVQIDFHQDGLDSTSLKKVQEMVMKIPWWLVSLVRSTAMRLFEPALNYSEMWPIGCIPVVFLVHSHIVSWKQSLGKHTHRGPPDIWKLGIFRIIQVQIYPPYIRTVLSESYKRWSNMDLSIDHPKIQWKKNIFVLY